MIVGFRHKGLEAFYNKGTIRGIQASHVKKLRNILALLDVAAGPNDMNLPSFKLHPLKGDLKGHWSFGSTATGVSLSALPAPILNWSIIRITIKADDDARSSPPR